MLKSPVQENRTPGSARGAARATCGSTLTNHLKHTQPDLISACSCTRILVNLLAIDNTAPRLKEEDRMENIQRVEKAFFMFDELEKQVSERKELSGQLMQAVLRDAFEGKSLAKE